MRMRSTAWFVGHNSNMTTVRTHCADALRLLDAAVALPFIPRAPPRRCDIRARSACRGALRGRRRRRARRHCLNAIARAYMCVLCL